MASLDSGQYSRKEIEKYEAIYGHNFVSPGGLATTQEFCAMLDLHDGMGVLDVGCGLGGAAFYMAEHFAAQVDGLDLSSNMLAFAHERCASLGLSDRVHLIHGDILEFQPAAPYARIYSRDVFLHIQDKARLFTTLYRCLQPGGKLLFTDYCCGEEEKSEEFADYIQQRQYALCTVAEYGGLLQQAGFVNVQAADRTAQFIEILYEEAARLPQTSLDPASKAALQESWQSKIARSQRGEQRWGLFQAQR
ncbi:MAG: methyltransferase domain-containing protein [Caldilineaceae bacterium]